MNRPDTILLYGETDTGKTASLGEAAEWVWDTFNEMTLLVSADSGWKSIPSKLLKGGVVEPWNVSGLPDPWGVMADLMEGFWPKVVEGKGGPKLRMVPLQRKDGRLLFGPPGEERVVGLMAFEGISTIGNTGLQDHIRTGRQVGEKPVGVFTSKVEEESSSGLVTEKEVKLAKAAPSHFGQVQDWILLNLVPKSSNLPVRYVVWTGHETKGEDEINSRPVLGPATVGKATADRTVQKFGFAFHLTSETFLDPKGLLPIRREFRAWFVKHPDLVLSALSWPTKVGLEPSQSAELLRRFPKGFIPLSPEKGKGFSQFLKFLQEVAPSGAGPTPGTSSEERGPFF